MVGTNKHTFQLTNGNWRAPRVFHLVRRLNLNKAPGEDLLLSKLFQVCPKWCPLKHRPICLLNVPFKPDVYFFLISDWGFLDQYFIQVLSIDTPLLPNRKKLSIIIDCLCVLSCFSRVWLFETLWTVASQAPLSMGFSRQEYWSG